MNVAKSFAPERSISRAMRLSWGKAHKPPAIKNNRIASESRTRAVLPIARAITTIRRLVVSGNA